eukprot:CAMPEP_0172864920 /NCGR_PEP_ID=MMETSP1075-20121228/81108_1 /TAXON_ID=2916 /ORGANISM="Ceratium fusus, Strain PA161109" /LENGTH=205 /DNA_ID=CAMNT_0013713889 /DNA_START=49 /DNA_END=663 /DNA_ORIENTATION=+
MSRMHRAHLYAENHGPIRFHKIRKSKTQQSPIIYGWQHNTPWAKYNNFAYYWSEQRPIRKTVVNHAQRVKQLQAFGERLELAHQVVQELSQQGPFTLFCPSNEAMSLIRDGNWDKLWEEERTQFLKHHVVKGRWTTADLVTAASSGGPGPLTSLANQPLHVAVQGSLDDMNRVIQVSGAALTKANIRCWNGFVHIIDHPLVPKWR